MKLFELKPNQTISVEDAKELFGEIRDTHCFSCQSAQQVNEEKTLVHCRIQQIGKAIGGGRYKPIEPKGEIIEFYVKSDKCV